MILTSKGLFKGDRLAKVSDRAKWMYPYLTTASNGYARLEFQPKTIIATCFGQFQQPPTEEELVDVVTELYEQHLAFLYSCRGQLWIQFTCEKKYLKRHKTEDDLASPAPPEPAYSDWLAEYEAKREAAVPESVSKIRALFIPAEISEKAPRDLREISAEKARGVGVGVGVGKVKVKPSAPATPLPDWMPAQLWADFEEMRNRIKKPLTDRARKLLLLKLENFRARGIPPIPVVEESIMNSWQGFWDPTQKNGKPQSLPATAGKSVQEVIQERNAGR